MKKSALLLGFCLIAFSIQAQNLIINGDMTGTNLDYQNHFLATTTITPAPGTGWGAYYSASATAGVPGNYNKVDITTVTDLTQGDVIKLKATGSNGNVEYASRLAQRLDPPVSIGIYRLTFKAKAVTATNSILIPTVRVGVNNAPFFIFKDAVNTAIAVYKPIPLTQTWTTYSIDYDLSKTTTSAGPSPTILNATADSQPAICFAISCSTTEATSGVEILVDDVSFTLITPLPIELISFNGKVDKLGSSALLEWKTGTNGAAKSIAIEKSIDGKLFSEIASVNPREDKNYAYTDKQFNGQNAYYRLNQTDIDGTNSYSPVIYLKYDKTASLNVFPNPASDKITISFPKSTDVSTLRIISSTGKTVYQSKVSAQDSQTTINIQKLAAGTYIVILESNNDKQYFKFVK